jgi:hypothetical protein
MRKSLEAAQNPLDRFSFEFPRFVSWLVSWIDCVFEIPRKLCRRGNNVLLGPFEALCSKIINALLREHRSFRNMFVPSPEDPLAINTINYINNKQLPIYGH